MHDSLDNSGDSGGSRARGKNAGGTPKSLLHVFADELADDWVEVVDQLCSLLELPGTWLVCLFAHSYLFHLGLLDLTTRNGLKKVHSNLPAIQQQLEEAFKYAKRTRHIKVMGGIITIYTKMCMVDAILQTKILAQGSFESDCFRIAFIETCSVGFYQHLVTLEMMRRAGSR